MQSLRENNFVYLLLALLALLIGVPVLGDILGWHAPLVRAVAMSTVLLLSIGSLQRSGIWFAGGVLLVVVGIALNVLTTRATASGVSIAALFCFLAFLILMTTTAVRQVFAARAITPNRLIGALCIYLLLGAVWSTAYLMVYEFDPSAFTFRGAGGAPLDLQEFQYFSLVTLTTLGYGDVVPVSATARAMAVIQAVLGQFYLAILVAGLVAGYVSARTGREGGGPVR